MTSPLSLCTGARPEICLSPKNIRIPAQEGRLGFSAAWADGQRAGGEERRGEDSRGVERRGKRERLFFSGPLPSILIGPPRALFPRSSGAEHGGDCPVIGTALSIRKNGTGKTQRHRRAQIPLPVSVRILCFDLKPSQIQKKKISNYTQTKSSCIKKKKKKAQIKSVEMNTNNE